jgi:hypothetical protein
MRKLHASVAAERRGGSASPRGHNPPVMRGHAALLWVSCAGFAFAWACHGNDNPNVIYILPDAGDDADAADDVSVDAGEDYYIGVPEGSTNPCSLFDGTDPVAFCIQKRALGAQLSGAYAKTAGVAPSWDSMTGITGTPHSWRDDVGFASSIASFHCSSAIYGDTDLAPQLDAVLPDLAQTIVGELTAAPTGYDGEDYFRLRNAVVGINYVDTAEDATLGDAATIAQLADTFGRNLQGTYAQTVTWDGGDAGTTATLLGTSDGQGHVVYAPAQVVMGAAALLDMAIKHPTDTSAATWVATALSSLQYVWARGRDTVSGLFYQQLVTSGDPGHDALGQGSPTPDALLTDVQAEAVLGFARVQDRLNTLMQAGDAGMDGSTLGQAVYWQDATTIVQALATANLFDGTMSPSQPPPPGAFMAAFIPSTAATDTNKTTIGNAWLLGGFGRVAVGLVSHLSDVVLGQLRAALIEESPPNSSLYSVVTDMGGSSIQTAYLQAASKSYGYDVLFSPDGGTGGQDPTATSYRSDAVAAMVEGFTQLWIDAANPVSCSP